MTTAQARAPVAGTVLCPTCGGPNELHAGVATDTCTYCHATFAPDRAIRAAGVDASEQARREAALARYRQERITVAGLMSQGGSTQIRGMPARGALALLAGMLGSLSCVGSCFGGMQNLSGGDEAGSWIGVLAGALFGLVALAAAAALGVSAKKLHEQNVEAARAGAERFGGQPVSGLVGTSRWLGALWAGPYDLALLATSEGYVARHGVVAGYPWLFELAPGGREPRAQVLVAAFFSETPDASRTQSSERVLAELSAACDEVRIDEAGARARFRPEAAGPERVAHLRDRLLVLAAQLGGRPVAAPASDS